MRLDEAFAFLKKKFPKLIDVSNPEKINQNGLYLYFDGSSPVSPAADAAHFVLLLVGNSFSGKGDADVFAELIRIREEILTICVGVKNARFRGIKTATFEGSSLFMYAILVDLEITVKAV